MQLNSSTVLRSLAAWLPEFEVCLFISEIPFLASEEGAYLTAALKEPLIQGLTEVASRRPADPISHLARFLQHFSKKEEETIGTPIKEPAALIEEPQSFEIMALPADKEETKKGNLQESEDLTTSRDEYGQSILHFAAARTQGRNALFQLIQESGVNLGFRDELYRTARDVAIQAELHENVREIDRFVLGLAARGETERLIELLLEGYDHLLDIEDDRDDNVIEIVTRLDHKRTLAFLKSIPAFEEKRERLHRAVRADEKSVVNHMMTESIGAGRLLAIGKSTTGRAVLHVAVLLDRIEIVEFIAQKFPETLQLGDNLERTALHYAMASDHFERLSDVLIKCGAERVAKDLKGRQPSYYFMNKSDVFKLKDEEELLRM